MHLVGGFLGSGKTTAIVQACKLLAARGLRAGVVTNDQGKFLVDTAFVRLQDFPAVEVGGGCFCCNYGDLETQLQTLMANAAPDVIFAESVGSCADLVATVVKPLLALRHSPVPPASFSVFADARLLSLHLRGMELPFSDDVVYIFEQQLEEAGLLVVNKLDLIPVEKQPEILARVRERYPGKPVLGLCALEAESIQNWLERLDSSEGLLPEETLSIDYQRYGRGEQQLSWLDQQLTLRLPEEGRLTSLAAALLGGLDEAVRAEGIAIGHLKFVVADDAGNSGKVSFTSLPSAGWEDQIPALTGRRLTLDMNMRVEMPAEDLNRLVNQTLQRVARQFLAEVEGQDPAVFHPGLPRPTHRITGAGK